APPSLHDDDDNLIMCLFQGGRPCVSGTCCALCLRAVSVRLRLRHRSEGNNHMMLEANKSEMAKWNISRLNSDGISSKSSPLSPNWNSNFTNQTVHDSRRAGLHPLLGMSFFVPFPLPRLAMM